MTFEIYNNNGYIPEKCVVNQFGDFVGILTGNVYKKENYCVNKPLKAQVVYVEPSRNDYKFIRGKNIIKLNNRKRKFIGCELDFVYAYDFNGHKVYKAEEIGEYFFDTELRFL